MLNLHFSIIRPLILKLISNIKSKSKFKLQLNSAQTIFKMYINKFAGHLLFFQVSQLISFFQLVFVIISISSDVFHRKICLILFCHEVLWIHLLKNDFSLSYYSEKRFIPNYPLDQSRIKNFLYKTRNMPSRKILLLRIILYVNKCCYISLNTINSFKYCIYL